MITSQHRLTCRISSRNRPVALSRTTPRRIHSRQAARRADPSRNHQAGETSRLVTTGAVALAQASTTTCHHLTPLRTRHAASTTPAVRFRRRYVSNPGKIVSRRTPSAPTTAMSRPDKSSQSPTRVTNPTSSGRRRRRRQRRYCGQRDETEGESDRAAAKAARPTAARAHPGAAGGPRRSSRT